MKKIKLLLLLAFIGVNSTNAQTLVSGGIYTNTTWTLANSPYIVTGNIVVFPGVTLTIQPGVEVKVRSVPIANPLYYIETRGTINMIGTSNAQIKIAAETDKYSVSVWNGFVIKNSQGGKINYDYVSISNANTLFSYDNTPPDTIKVHKSEFNFNSYALNANNTVIADSTSFKGNVFAIYGWTNFKLTNCLFDSNLYALSIYASSLDVSDCRFERNLLGINLQSSVFNNLSIKNCSFSKNLSGILNPNNGIIDSCDFFDNQTGITSAYDVIIKNSKFDSNDVAVEVSYNATVSNCEVKNNVTGVAISQLTAFQPVPTIINNKICQNSNYNIDNKTDLNLFIPTNCFCESDSSIIEAKILDGYDDITKGLISYGIFDTTCTNVVQIVNKQGSALSIQDKLAKDGFSFYPNPTNGTVYLKSTDFLKSIQILDLSGKVINTFDLSDNQEQIDLSGLEVGIYMFQTKNKQDKLQTFKLYKQ
jgi:hypothetical protein